MAAKKETERRSAERRAAPKAAPRSGKPAAQPAGFDNSGAGYDRIARSDISPEDLRKLISEAAYYRAKERGFEPGHEMDDWVQAEREVMRRIERSQ
jgi:hypothetical protein